MAASIGDMRWFDETKQPVLQVGSLTIPACILPIFLSLLAPISWRFWKGWLPEIEEGHDEKLSALDDINEEKKEPVGKRQSAPYELPAFWRFVLGCHNMQWTSRCFFDPSQVFESPSSRYMMASQPLTLLLVEYYRYRTITIPTGLASLGWVVMMLPSTSHPAWKASAICILAVPTATNWPAGSITGTGTENALSLIVLAVQSILPADSAVRKPTLFHLQVWPLLLALLLLLCGIGVELIRKGTFSTTFSREARDQPLRQTIQQHFTKTVVDILQTIVDLTAALGPLAFFAVAAVFTCSCFGWRWAVLGLPATPPSIYGASFLAGGLLVYAWAFILNFTNPMKIDRRGNYNSRLGFYMKLLHYEVVIGSIALMWTDLVLTGFWMLVQLVGSF